MPIGLAMVATLLGCRDEVTDPKPVAKSSASSARTGPRPVRGVVERPSPERLRAVFELVWFNSDHTTLSLQPKIDAATSVRLREGLALLKIDQLDRADFAVSCTVPVTSFQSQRIFIDGLGNVGRYGDARGLEHSAEPSADEIGSLIELLERLEVWEQQARYPGDGSRVGTWSLTVRIGDAEATIYEWSGATDRIPIIAEHMKAIASGTSAPHPAEEIREARAAPDARPGS